MSQRKYLRKCKRYFRKYIVNDKIKPKTNENDYVKMHKKVFYLNKRLLHIKAKSAYIYKTLGNGCFLVYL